MQMTPMMAIFKYFCASTDSPPELLVIILPKVNVLFQSVNVLFLGFNVLFAFLQSMCGSRIFAGRNACFRFVRTVPPFGFPLAYLHIIKIFAAMPLYSCFCENFSQINIPRHSRGFYYNGPKGLKLPAALKSACTVRPLHTISCYP